MKWTREAAGQMTRFGYPSQWREAIAGYLAIQDDKVADYNSRICVWHVSRELIGHTFKLFALPITWDFTQLAVVNEVGGAYSAQLEWLSFYIDHGFRAARDGETPMLQNRSALQVRSGQYDVVVTDQPYYDAIPYSDLMDFFHLWLKRSLNGLSPELDAAFGDLLSPKWNS